MNRNVNSRFSELPQVDTQRSKFSRPHSLKTTFNAGELIPIFLDMDVLPGDTYTLDLSSLVRMTTPIFPTMDNCYLDTYFFFVPNRLVWEHWRQFMGENSQGYWTQQIEYQIPQLQCTDYSFKKGSLGDYFGLPTDVIGISVSSLPFRAYTLIWNEWFRDQNTMQPAYFRVDDNDIDVEDPDNYDDTFDNRLIYAIRGHKPLPVSKYHDYFTSVLPQPQKGPAVDLPLYNDFIPVAARDESVLVDDKFPFSEIRNLRWWAPTISSTYTYPLAIDGIGSMSDIDGLPTTVKISGDNGSYNTDPNRVYTPVNLWADVSNVAVATISQLRQAFQLQRLFEKDARGGTRYRELLKAHFGVDNADSRLQVPEYLGGKRIPINIDQVLQTSSTDAVSPQGNTAAFSLTSDVSSTFTKSFTEHGMIIGLACVRTDHTYQQGIERGWSRKERFDFYWPTLANISEQAVLVKEIYATGDDEQDNRAFGYQEAWADYRYKPSRVTGAFRSNYAQTLDSWHYADYYTGGNENFVLSPEWLCETKVNIDRTLAVQSSLEDQFLADFFFKLDCVRPMPLYSIPGLVDHY